ncbi:MAG: coproporphyrinogen dehydrogenase HemZ [Lachnospiraceae bacterium]|nr:coproporphyrinogen dehydrogenase HemZ [Lachnospiraceae bacterium]
MIAVILNKAEYEYDVHSLVKAFFPGIEVNIYAPIPDEKTGTGARSMEKLEEFYHEAEIIVDYDFQGNKACVAIRKTGRDENEAECSFEIAYENRNEARNVLKGNIYKLLAGYTKKELPWGTLTGIRPTKFALNLLEEGKSEAEIADFMSETFYTSKEKTMLSLKVATNEKKLLDNLDFRDGYSLYVGIPFCPSTCLYCSFTSYPITRYKERLDDYLLALEKELAFTAKSCRNKKLNTIYIGGGTPTTLAPDELDRLIGFIKKTFDLSYCKEFTVEAGRPDSITREKLEVIKKHGITRISINPQTMCQETLNIIGRKHTVLQTLDAYELARDMGFTNINMDIILGLPNEDEDTVKRTLDWMEKINPDNLTVHSLALKRAARLNIFKDDYKELTFENTNTIMGMTQKCASNLNMEPYYLYRQKNMAGNFENVGYAKADKACIYNILIMEEKQTIMACGAGASTKFVVDGESYRIIAQKDIDTYIDNLDELLNKKKLKMEELKWL